MFNSLVPYANSTSGVPSTWKRRRVKTLLSEIDRRTATGTEPLLSLRARVGLVDHVAAGGKPIDASALVGYKIVKPGELVMNRMRAATGVFGLADREGLVSPDYAVFQLESDVVPAYLLALLRTPTMADQMRLRSRGMGTGESGFLRLYTDAFGAMPLVIPPVEEQRTIVVYLVNANRRINRAVATKRRLLELLREQEKAIIRETVSRGVSNAKLKESGLAWLGPIPEHWSVVAMRYLATLGNGSTPARSNPSYWTGGTYPWLNSSVVNQGVVRAANQHVTDVALAECHLPFVPRGSVLIGITGQGRTRGMAALLDLEATINQHLAFLTPDRSKLDSEYLTLVLKAAYPELRRISSDSGSTKGALTVADLKAFRIPTPPMDEQHVIVRNVERQVAATRQLADRANQEITLLEEFRTRLESDVVSGQVDVREIATALSPLGVADVCPAVEDSTEADDDEIAVEDLVDA